MRDLYRILGVREGADADEIKRAYRQLARRYHPDMGGKEAAPSFVEVRQAYETLSDEQKRRTYDRHLAAHRRPGVPAHNHRDWFADEVAIDFPSVAEVVERIRDAFLGQERVAPVRAEILLSPREAYEGITVPLAVPIRDTCTVCGGRGETWAELCRNCEGTGERFVKHHVQLSVPAGVADGARFSFRLSSPMVPPTRVEIRVAIR